MDCQGDQGKQGGEDENHHGTDADINGGLAGSAPIFQRPLFHQDHGVGANRRNLAAFVTEAYEIGGEAEIGNGTSNLVQDHGDAVHRVQWKGNHNQVDLLLAAPLQKVGYTAAHFNPILFYGNA